MSNHLFCLTITSFAHFYYKLNIYRSAVIKSLIKSIAIKIFYSKLRLFACKASMYANLMALGNILNSPNIFEVYMEELVYLALALGGISTTTASFYIGYKYCTNNSQQSAENASSSNRSSGRKIDVDQLQLLFNHVTSEKTEIAENIQKQYDRLYRWHMKQVSTPRFYKPGKATLALEMNERILDMLQLFRIQLKEYPSYEPKELTTPAAISDFRKKIEQRHDELKFLIEFLLPEMDAYFNLLEEATTEKIKPGLGLRL